MTAGVRIAVIVTTYNRPDALGVPLAVYAEQTDDAFELLVADDGSTSDTAALVRNFAARASFPVAHIWHEDRGFRAAAIRNAAVARTSADYVVFTDGDCIPPPCFVDRHRALAAPGWFVAGNRILLPEHFTRAVLAGQVPIQRWGPWRWVAAWLARDANRLLPLITAVPDVVLAWGAEEEVRVASIVGTPADGIAVMHPCPNFNYKKWPQENWIALGHKLAARGLRLILTGGPAPQEKAYVGAIADALGAPSVAGLLSITETTCLIAGARLFVGPDTATTHMAAALNVPTIALFGPSDPVKWGPWPTGFAGPGTPWQRRGSQQLGNVTLLQGPGACVPCRLEGCERRTESFSDCLRNLPVDEVAAAAILALQGSAGDVPVEGAVSNGRRG